jgi:hypothetical protein
MPVYGAGARVRGARERGGPRPRAGQTLERDATRSRWSEPSSGAGPLEGTTRGAVPVGRWSPAAWAVSCMVSHLHG